MKPGYHLQLSGQWVEHERYGPQFSFTDFSLPMPTSLSSLASYLSSTLPGIGPKLAARIIAHYGTADSTIAAFDSSSPTLSSIKGISPLRRSAILTTWAQHSTQRSLNLFFSSHHIPPRQGQQLVDEYGDNVQAVITANPYVVVELIGFGWAKADALAQRLGFTLTCPERVRGALSYQLTEAMREGHVFVPHKELVEGALLALNERGQGEEELVAEAEVQRELQALVDAGTVVRENVAGYNHVWRAPSEVVTSLPSPSPPDATSEPAIVSSSPPPPTPAAPAGGPPLIAYFSRRAWQLELQLAREVQRLLSPASQAARTKFLASRHITPASLDTWMTAYESAQKVTFTAEQRRAIRSAILGSVCIITGIPGSGKTFLLQAITSYWAEHAVTFLLTSPTGRGAQRMEESTGREAMTCHRALRWVPQAQFVSHWGEAHARTEWKKQKAGLELLGKSPGAFLHTRANPLTQAAYVVDEVSMMDLPLLTAFVAALPSQASLVLVGDPDQLPSVGVGNVLRDLISAATVPVCRLTEPLRQLTASTLHSNVRAVNAGRMPQLVEVTGEAPQGVDSMFVRDAGVDPLPALRWVTETLCPRVGLDPRRDVQVLAPIKRGAVGTQALNAHMQELLNPPRPGVGAVGYGGVTYRVGDRVVQRWNDYEVEVFNGDIGWVQSVDGEGEVAVQFPHAVVRYRGAELEGLGLAWAMTVHKAQGSEYGCVVLFCTRAHQFMLYRSLLYTAVSRARRMLVVVGGKDVMVRGLWKKEERGRRTALRLRLRRAAGMTVEGEKVVEEGTEVTGEKLEAVKEPATTAVKRRTPARRSVSRVSV